MQAYMMMIFCSLGMTIFADVISVKVKDSFFKKVFISNILMMSAIPPIIVGSIRYDIGVDYRGYIDLHIPYVLNGWDTSFRLAEPGYHLVIRLGNFLGQIFITNAVHPFQMVFVLTQAIIVFFVYKTIYKNEGYYTLCNFIFFSSMFFFSALNLMRQSIGTALFLYSIHYLKHNKVKKYIFINIIGISMHIISFVYIPAIFLSKIKKIPLFTVFIPLILVPFSHLIRTLLYNITHILGLSFSYYFDSVMDTGTVGYSLIFLHYSLLLVIYMGIKLGKKEEIEDNDCYSFFYYCQLITATATTLSSMLPNSFRLVSLFSFVPIVSLPFILDNQKNKKIKVYLILSVIVTLSVFFYYNIIILRSSEFFPFKTIYGHIIP